MNQFFKKIKQDKGTSLIELLVAITLFSILILSSTQIFKMVVDGQRNAISAQNVQENVRYAFEKISKEIKMAQISNKECLSSGVNKIFNTIDNELYFKNKDENCVKYYLENNRLKIDIAAITGFITPEKIEISNLKFYIVDDLIGAFHSTQPYVVIAMDVEATGQAIHKQKMKIQITVSSRYYE